MGGFELRVDSDAADGIYQNHSGIDEMYDDPSDSRASFVSVATDATPVPADVDIIGGAVDIGGGALAFDTQNISIAWAPDISLTTLGHGVEFHVARVTLKWGTTADFDLEGWQTQDQENPVDRNDSVANDGDDYGLWDTILSKTGYMSLLSGDVDGNGSVNGADMTIVLANWGLSGVGRAGGDLNGNGTVDGPDWTEVAGVLATPPPEPPQATPEPTSLLMLLGGTLAGLLRRRI